MNYVPNRTKLRRKYLMRTAANWFAIVATTPIVLVCVVGVFLSVLWLVYSVWLMGTNEMVRRHYSDGNLGQALASTILWSTGTWLSFRGMRHLQSNIQELVVVPPVNADTLPVDKILVRGSEEPSIAENEILLRAAQGSDTPKEELLRMTEEG